jgi:hypothetical protein
MRPGQQVATQEGWPIVARHADGSWVYNASTTAEPEFHGMAPPRPDQDWVHPLTNTVALQPADRGLPLEMSLYAH